jgi:hypothetical protein
LPGVRACPRIVLDRGFPGSLRPWSDHQLRETQDGSLHVLVAEAGVAFVERADLLVEAVGARERGEQAGERDVIVAARQLDVRDLLGLDPVQVRLKV